MNNLARFSVESRSFSAVQSPTPQANNTHIGVTKSCQPSDVDCDPSSQVSMVRTLKCAPSGSSPCGALYVGGYFDKVAGTPASGLVRVVTSDPDNATVSFEDPKVYPCGSDGKATNTTPGVAGLVMTAEEISEKGEVIYGGIYDDEGDMPYLLNRYTVATGRNR